MKRDILRHVVGGVLDNDNMWLITDALGCLFRYSLSRTELELEAVFPEPLQSVRGAFEQMVKLENEIYLIPRMAKDIYCYHLLEKKFQKLNIPFEGFLADKKMRAVVQGKYIYCINRFPDVVIKIDSVTKEVKMFWEDIKQYTKGGSESIVYRMYKEPCLYQGEVIWPNYSNTLTVFSTEKEKFYTITLEERPCGRIERFSNVFGEMLEDWIVGITAFGDTLWLFSFEGKIFQYHNGTRRIENQLLDNYVRYVDDDRIRGYIIYDIVALNKGLWIIPSYKNKCIKYCGLEQYEEAFTDYAENWKGNRRSYCKILNGTNIWLYSYYESCFYVLNTEDDSVSKQTIYISYAKLSKGNTEFERMLVKDENYCFDDLEYLYKKLLAEDKETETQKKATSDTIGRQIYQAMIAVS